MTLERQRSAGLGLGGWLLSLLLAGCLHAAIALPLFAMLSAPPDASSSPIVLAELADEVSTPSPSPVAGSEPPDLAHSSALATPHEASKPAPHQEHLPYDPSTNQSEVELPQHQVQSSQQAAPEMQAETAQLSVAGASGHPAAPDAGHAQALIDKAVFTAWQRQLAIHLQQFRRFPPGLRGTSGRVLVSFTLDRSGRVVQRVVVRSSGNDLLDREALSLIDRAGIMPPPPDVLPEEALTQVVPVDFLGRR